MAAHCVRGLAGVALVLLAGLVADARVRRTNVQLINVDQSPVGGVFDFSLGGQTGNSVSVATSF